MRVQRVVMPGSGVGSWTVVGDDHVPVDPVERFLGYLASVERSPNTVKAYAHDLKDWFSFLAGQRLDWQAVTVEDVAGFVGWLRLPPAARDGRVMVLPSVEHHCGGASVNRKLAALTSFCEFHARLGTQLSGCWSRCSPPAAGWQRRPTGRFCSTSANAPPHRRRAVVLPAPVPRPLVLTAREAQAIWMPVGICGPAAVRVNLWGCPQGHPMSYPAVYDLVKRLRRSTGISFGPHLFRPTYVISPA